MDGVLREAAAVGPFFALRTERGDRPDGYLPLAELYGTPDPLRVRIATVAGRLGTDETRVAASLAFQGLAARLWSVALGPAVLTGRVPDLAPDRLWWHPVRSAPHDLWLPDPAALPAGEDLADQLRAAVLTAHLAPLHHATTALTRVSGRLLWGNAASALAGTMRVLHDWCRAQGRPEAADRAVALTRALLATPPLRGTGTLAAAAPPGFVRRSCCLYYRASGGALCGDCALAR